MKTLQIGMGWFPEQPGGLNRFYYDCCNYLPEAGVEIQGLVAGSANVAAASGGKVAAFAPREAPLLQRWRGIRQSIRHHLSKDNYSLVASHLSLYTLPVLNQLKDHPLVMHFHGPWALEGQVEGSRSLSTCFKKILETQAYQRSTQFVVLSQAFHSVLRETYGVPEERINIVPGGVNVGRFNSPFTSDEARNRLDWPQGQPIIFAARRLAKRMGLENLITAMATVKATQSDALLLIAGRGALAETLQSQIETLGLCNNVRLLGYVSDENLILAYRAADFSVVPTTAFEGFGLIVIESLAAGTPVLGTPIGGIPEILRPFSEQLLFDDASVEAIARGICEVFTGQRQLPDEADCKAYVNQHYAWPVIAEQIKSVYQSALDT